MMKQGSLFCFVLFCLLVEISQATMFHAMLIIFSKRFFDVAISQATTLHVVLIVSSKHF
jgi:hypothetical protein